MFRVVAVLLFAFCSLAPTVVARAAVLTNYVLQWGSPGTGNGQFNQPVGVAVDFNGNVYVTDMGNDRVQVFNSSGTWQFSFGGTGSGPGQFRGPYGVGINGGDPYVVDTGNYLVQKFDSSFLYSTQWGGTGAGNSQFVRPHSAAIDGSYIHVVDTGNDRVQKFGTPSDGPCATCFSPPEACCAALPQIGGPWTNIALGTRVSDPTGP